MSSFGGYPTHSDDGLSITPHGLAKGRVIDAYGPAQECFGGDAVGRNAAPILASLLDPRIAHRYFEDFIATPRDDTTGLLDGWAVVADAGSTGSQTLFDRAGGWYYVYSDGDANDEAYASTRNECWKFEADKPLWFRARVQHAATSTPGKGCFVVGLSDVAAANTLVDTTGALVASFDGAVFHKAVDGTNLRFVTSNAASQVANNTAAWVEDDIYEIEFFFNPVSATAGVGTVTPWVNGVEYPSHNITLAGLEEMHVLIGTKAAGEAAETLIKVDYVEVLQKR